MKSKNQFLSFGGWVSRDEVQQFFNYGKTKMASFAAEHNITVCRIGRRIFYAEKDIIRLLEENSY
jgi:hypothetical protein